MHSAADIAYKQLDDSAKDFARGISLATQLSSATEPVLFGTITFPNPTDASSATYRPKPANQLIISAGEKIVRYRNNEIVGREAFRYDFSLDGKNWATIQVNQQTGTYNGFLSIRDRAYNANLSFTGSRFSDNGGGYVEESSVRQTKGTLKRGSINAQVDEEWKTTLISSSDASAQSADRKMNHSFSIGTDRYVWQNARQAKRYRNGEVSQYDTEWASEGSILRNGAAFAKYGMKLGVLASNVQFFVNINGQVFLLEQRTTNR